VTGPVYLERMQAQALAEAPGSPANAALGGCRSCGDAFLLEGTGGIAAGMALRVVAG